MRLEEITIHERMSVKSEGGMVIFIVLKMRRETGKRH